MEPHGLGLGFVSHLDGDGEVCHPVAFGQNLKLGIPANPAGEYT